MCNRGRKKKKRRERATGVFWEDRRLSIEKRITTKRGGVKIGNV